MKKTNTYAYRRLQAAADRCPECGGSRLDDCYSNYCPLVCDCPYCDEELDSDWDNLCPNCGYEDCVCDNRNW